MNSRQRIREVLNGKLPDRIPIDLGAAPCTGIATIAYNNLRKKLGMTKGLARMYDFRQQMAYPEEEVLQFFHIDTIDAGQGFLKSDENWKEWTLNDGSKCLILDYLNIETDKDSNVLLKDENGFDLGKKPKNSLYVDQSYWVYRGMEKIPETFDEKDLRKNMWTIPGPPWHLNIYDDHDFEIFISGIRDLYNNMDYSIMLSVGCNLFEMGQWLRGMDIFLMDMCLDHRGVNRLFEHLVARYLKLLERVISGVGKYVDVLMVADDLGMQNGPFISPEVFKKTLIPHYKIMYQYIHENSDCKIFLHSCGSMFELIPDLIDIGLDILNPVQTTTRNMEPEKLKKEFGKDLVFWGGGSNTRDILPTGTLKEIREDVKRRIDILGKDGGFVFNPIHNIMANVPPENAIAMLEAAYEYGKY